jgi:hypothetical protein
MKMLSYRAVTAFGLVVSLLAEQVWPLQLRAASY